MGVSIRIKNNRLYLDVIQNRKHYWESLHITLAKDSATRKEQMQVAEICRAKRELQLLTGEWNLEDKIAGKQTLIEYMRKMVEKEEMNPKTPFVRSIAYLEKFKYGNVKISEVNEKWISDWQKFLLEHPQLSQMTAANYSKGVRHALNNAYKERIIIFNPCKAVKGIPQPETNLPTLTVDEFKALEKTEVNGELGNEVKRGFLFACYTGLRVSDVSSLRWRDIEVRPITKENQCRWWIYKKQRKTREFVEIPLVKEAMALITPNGLMGFPENFVFDKLARTNTHTDGYIKKWAKNARLEKKISWHTARRSCATFLLEANADPFTVQKIMGHKKIEMTGIYAKTDRKKSGAVNALQNLLNEDETDISIKNRA